MRNKTRLEVYHSINDLYPGVNISRVGIMPAGPTMLVADWMTMIADCDAWNEPYTPGAHVTFHFEDTTFVHLKF